MFAIRTLRRLPLAAMVAVGLACGDDDDPTGPGSVTFPDWPATVVTAFCVRGNAVVGETKSGTISDTDCDVADVDPSDEGYFEVWRVRVASARDVTFDANSTFDNFLAVVRVNSVTTTSLDVEVVGENDDRAPLTNTNALVTVRLEPNVDYAVAISGFDYTETGPYTLAIR
jgi:hypothetical protein